MVYQQHYQRYQHVNVHAVYDLTAGTISLVASTSAEPKIVQLVLNRTAARRIASELAAAADLSEVREMRPR